MPLTRGTQLKNMTRETTNAAEASAIAGDIKFVKKDKDPARSTATLRKVSARTCCCSQGERKQVESYATKAKSKKLVFCGQSRKQASIQL